VSLPVRFISWTLLTTDSSCHQKARLRLRTSLADCDLRGGTRLCSRYHDLEAVLGLPRHHRWQANRDHQLQDLDLDSGHNNVEHRPKSPPAAPLAIPFAVFLPVSSEIPQTCVSFSNLRVHCQLLNLRVHCLFRTRVFTVIKSIVLHTAFTKTKANSKGETQIEPNQISLPSPESSFVIALYEQCVLPSSTLYSPESDSTSVF
jgi:hypothetical protein